MYITCERCGLTFLCQKDNYNGGGKCWCDDIKLSKEVTGKMSEISCDCLCKKCLAELAHQKRV